MTNPWFEGDDIAKANAEIDEILAPFRAEANHQSLADVEAQLAEGRDLDTSDANWCRDAGEPAPGGYPGEGPGGV